jgi:D-alanyl-lipoteichoic acid acyltransferase DltB (MBOAT superfamily)
MITMLLGGLWHGASWRFIIWGALHGMALSFHKFYRSRFPKSNSDYSGVKNFARVMVTFHFVCFCWIFFRAANMATVGEMVHQIFFEFNFGVLSEFVSGYRVVLMLMVIGYLLHFIPKEAEVAAQETITSMPLAGKAAFMLAVIVLVIQTKSSGIQPFIYFQF